MTKPTSKIAIGLHEAANALIYKASELRTDNQKELADAYTSVAKLLRLIMTDEEKPDEEKHLYTPEPVDLLFPAMDYAKNFLRYPGKLGGIERNAWSLQAFIETADQIDKWMGVKKK